MESKFVGKVFTLKYSDEISMNNISSKKISNNILIRRELRKYITNNIFNIFWNINN